MRLRAAFDVVTRGSRKGMSYDAARRQVAIVLGLLTVVAIVGWLLLWRMVWK